MDNNLAKGINRREFIAGIAAFGIMATLPGCSSNYTNFIEGTTASQEETNTSGYSNGSLRFCIGDPVCIEPFNAYEEAGMQVCHALFDSLITYDFQSSSLVPLAASSWQISDDATIFTFALVEGALFHDGEPVTASSFKYAWERMAAVDTNPSSPSKMAQYLSPLLGYTEFTAGTSRGINGIRALDDYTLEVVLTAPDPEFIYILAHPSFAPVPTAAENFQLFSTAPIGNGPFIMDGDWVDGQYIKVARNDGYYRTIPRLEGIDFVIFDDEKAAYLEFQVGKLDFSPVPTEEISDALTKYPQASDGYTIDSTGQFLLGDETSVYYLSLNCEEEVLQNLSVRKAISLAIDRQTICDTFFSGAASPATGVISKNIGGYVEGSWVNARYDVAAAKKALIDAGYADGFGLPTMEIAYSEDDGYVELSQMIASNLSAVGIPVEMKAVDKELYLENLQGTQYEIGCLRYTPDHPRMGSILSTLFLTHAEGNYSKYSNATFDAGVATAHLVLEESERRAALQKLDTLVGDETPIVPILFCRHHQVGSARIGNLYYGPDGLGELVECSLNS